MSRSALAAWFWVALGLAGAPAAPEDPAVHLLPKYGNPDYETKWSTTPEAEQDDAKRFSREADKRGWERLRANDPDGAIKRFNQAWTLWDKNPTALWGMAIVVLERTRALAPDDKKAVLASFDQAVGLITEASKLAPADPPLLTDLALIHANRAGFRKYAKADGAQQDFEAAASALRLAEEKNGEPHVQIETTWEALERYRGNAEKADAHASKAQMLGEREEEPAPDSEPEDE